MWNSTKICDKVFNFISKMPHAKLYQRYYRKTPIKKLANIGDISIVAVNCVGGELYHILGRRFNTPFINNSMERKLFVLMASHFEEYMCAPYRVEKAQKVSGIYLYLEPTELPAIKIRFPHDDNLETVSSNWEKRVSRLNYDKLVFICDDRGLDETDFRLYDTVEGYKKIMLTSKEIGYSWATILPASTVARYNFKDYFRGVWLFERQWDYSSFLISHDSLEVDINKQNQ